MKTLPKKLNNLIIKIFPDACLEDAIIFEKFDFGLSDYDELELKSNIIHQNNNWMVGNMKNIFLISNVDGEYTIQKLQNPLNFQIPNGFLHPEFETLVNLHFKSFTSFLQYKSLNEKLPSKRKVKPSKI